MLFLDKRLEGSHPFHSSFSYFSFKGKNNLMLKRSSSKSDKMEKLRGWSPDGATLLKTMLNGDAL